MTRFASHSLAYRVRVVLSICAGLLGSSCSPLQGVQRVTPAVAQVVQSAARLAQMNFGRQSEFSLCTPPACPTLTPKTLAPPLPRAASPDSRPPAAVSSFDPGEEIIPRTPRTTMEVTAISSLILDSGTKTVTVHFRFGDASLSAADKAVLDSAVTATHDAKYIVISGRTDSIGPPGLNELLATTRARTVHHYLRAAHPNLAPVLKLEAQGACCYVASNETERGRSLNRRVDVLFRGEGEHHPDPPPTH